MKDLLHDKKASRKAWIAFIVVIVLGGAISLLTVNHSPPVAGMGKGSHQLLVKNFTKYDVRVSGRLYGGLGLRPRMAFLVPAESIFLYEPPAGPALFIGRKGATIALRLSRVDDRPFYKNIKFNGYEGTTAVGDLLTIKRLWMESRWLLLIEDKEIEEQ